MTEKDPIQLGDLETKIVLLATDRAHVDFTGRYTNLRWGKGAVLRFFAPGVSDVECTASGILRPLIVRSGGWVTVSIGASRGDEEVTVRITFSFEPEFFGPPSLHLRKITALALPTLMIRNGGCTSRRSVRVEAHDERVAVLGPQYISSANPTTFSYIEYQTPFTLLVGKVDRLATVDGVSVLCPSSQETQFRHPTAESIWHRAADVRTHLARLFGDPLVKHRGVLVLTVPGLPSRSLGSIVIINLANVLGLNGGLGAPLVNELAHEYAHSWWSYSVAWKDRDNCDAINEMLAELLAYDAASTIEGADGISAFASSLWASLSYAAHQSEKILLANSSAPRGAYAAALLVQLLRRDRMKVMESLRALWREGRALALSFETFRQVMKSGLSENVAQAIEEAILRPKPVISKVRVHAAGPNAWGLSLRPRTGDHQRLVRRLNAVGVGFDQSPRNLGWLDLHVQQKSSVLPRVSALEPDHLLTTRSWRLLSLHSGSVMRRLWIWAAGTKKMRSDPALLARGTPLILSLVRGLVALALNPEDPSGWLLVSNALEPLSARGSKALRLRGAERAVYSGEEPFLDLLEAN